jgi:2'-5' RNA ligase
VRLFVAVDVPDKIKAAIETDVVDVLRPHVAGAKWTRPEGRHLTLEFLGETPEDRLAKIKKSLQAATKLHRRFEAAFEEVGGFPTLRRPRVLWIGIGDGATEMQALAKDVERKLEPLGFEPEGRPFTPHFTLARFARPRVIEEFPSTVVPTARFDVGEIVLFQSKLHPKGARYAALERFALR